MLRGAALTGAGLFGAAIAGCSSSNHNKGGAANPSRTSAGGTPSAGAAAAPPGASGAAALIGRTGQPAPPGEQPVRGGTYTLAIGGNPQGLDPHGTSSVNTFTAASVIMSRLMVVKTMFDINAANNRAVGLDLALSVESPDAQTWTVKLRPDARFHNVAPVNGHPVEADDVIATFQRGVAPRFPSAAGLSMIDPAQITSPAKDTVVFTLKFPFASFTDTLASGAFGLIFPREIASDGYDPNKVVIGSGPFIFDSYTPDVAFTMKRNPDYFDKQRPYLDGVKIAIVPDPNQQFAQFAAGNLDVLTNISQSNLPTFQKQVPTAETITNWGPGDGHIYYNMTDPASPFRDLRLRQAMSLALDRNALSKVAFEGKSIPNFYSSQSLGKWALKMEQLPRETAQWYAFDQQKAKQLASASGAAGLSVKYLSPSPYPSSGESPAFKAEREATYNMLQALPWKINLVLLDSQKEWINGGKGVRYGNFAPDSAVWAGLEGHTDIDEYIYTWYGSQSVANIGHLHDETLDQMLLKGRSLVDEDERLKQYIELQKYMAAQFFSVAGNPNGLRFTLVAQRVRNYLVEDLYGIGTGTWSYLWLRK